MVDRLPRPPSVAGGPWPRRWIAYERYRIVHESSIESLIAEGIVSSDRTSFYDRVEAGRLARVLLTGRIETVSGGILHIEKRLATQVRYGRPHVLTSLYAYHAQTMLTRGAIDIFRYDNCHGPADTLHRHNYDGQGHELGEEPVSLEELPPLSRIVRDVEFYARYVSGQAGEDRD